MTPISDLITNFPAALSPDLLPWEITGSLQDTLRSMISSLDDDYIIRGDDIAIHKSADVEEGAILKGPVIIGAGCFVGAHAYLRGGVYLGSSVTIGPGCEIKTSIILDHSSTAHFNFIGDSIIGSHVNFEAGAVIANHYNERENKDISIRYREKTINTSVQKFGAVVGDHSKVGANAVLSPGTLLPPHSIVRRLELINQCALPE